MLGLIDYSNEIDGQQVIQGVIQISIPTAGIVLVRPTSRNRIQDMLVCYLDSNNKYTGAGVYNTLQTGQSVTVAIRTGKHDCAILSQSNTNAGLWKYSPSFLIHNYTWTNPFYKTQFFQTLKAQVKQLTKNRAWLQPNACPQDVFPGDYVVGDKSGGHLFIGRTQTTLKGGSFCSVQLDAINQKIVQLYNQKQDISLYSYQKQTPNASMQLRAACIEEAAGTAYGQQNDTYTNNETQDGTPDIQIKNQRVPLFRHQRVQGSAYDGVYDIIVSHKPTQTKFDYSTNFLCLSAEHKSYNGKLDSRGQRLFQAKTPFLKAPQSIEGLDKRHLESAVNNFLSQRDPDSAADTSTQPFDRALVTDDELQSDIDMSFTAQQVGYMLQDCFYPYPDLGSQDSQLQWQEGRQKTQQQLAYPKYVDIVNKATGQQSRIYKSTSFIDQLQDGSICIKDGWGSQIRMVGGNIIISSALDTFIRPGRDCVQLVPRYKETTANGPLVIASKQSVKVAAQKDVKLASASAGGVGCTVIQNKTASPGASNSGVIIRSGSDMSVTAAKDMYIGLNDKTQQTAGKKVSPSSGSMIIDAGQTLTINAAAATKLMSGNVQLYSYTGNDGTGVVMSPGKVSITARQLDVESVVKVGRHSNGTPVQKLDDTKFFLQGAPNFSILVDGSIDCVQAVARKGIISVGNVVGATYVTTNNTTQQQIYTLQQRSRQQLLKNYGAAIKLQTSAITPASINLPSCYSDAFVYQGQLKLLGAAQYKFNQYTMPGVCWQQQSYKPEGIAFKPVAVVQAGEDQAMSYTYPGYQAWTSFGVITAMSDGQVNKVKLTGNYKTNTEEQIQEDSENGSN